jgi:hypothetical protein
LLGSRHGLSAIRWRAIGIEPMLESERPYQVMFDGARACEHAPSFRLLPSRPPPMQFAEDGDVAIGSGGMSMNTFMVGDVVRHPTGGLGVVYEAPALKVPASFRKGKSAVPTQRLALVQPTARFQQRLRAHERLSPDEYLAAYLYLRCECKELQRIGSVFFAINRPDGAPMEALRQLALDLKGSKRDTLMARVTSVRRGLLEETRSRPGEAVEARIQRIDRAYVRRGLPPLSAQQRRKLYHPYENHCWNCKDHISSLTSLPCRWCGWYVCACGACGCQWNGVPGDFW